jgi:hypothetical protein
MFPLQSSSTGLATKVLFCEKQNMLLGEKMKKERIMALIVVFCIILLAVPITALAKWLPKPNVDLPDNWFMEQEAPYTDYAAWHDPEGAGYVKYANKEGDGLLYIYYESALGKTYSNDELKDEAIMVFEATHEDPIADSGVMTVAGVSAGYVAIYYQENVIYLGLVFVKNNYYFDANAIYSTSEAETEVMSVLNSLDVSAAGIPLEIIAGSIIVVVVVAVVVLILFKKRKNTQITS